MNNKEEFKKSIQELKDNLSGGTIEIEISLRLLITLIENFQKYSEEIEEKMDLLNKHITFKGGDGMITFTA